MREVTARVAERVACVDKLGLKMEIREEKLLSIYKDILYVYCECILYRKDGLCVNIFCRLQIMLQSFSIEKYLIVVAIFMVRCP